MFGQKVRKTTRLQLRTTIKQRVPEFAGLFAREMG
jgi:hypothetical protein